MCGANAPSTFHRPIACTTHYVPLQCGQTAAQKSANLRPVSLVLMGTSAFVPSRAMVEEIGCEALLQKPVIRSTLRLLLARIDLDSTTPSATALQKGPQQLAGCHLLYAEDSLPSQKIVIKMLEKAGAKCTVVDNGKAAVMMILDNPTMFDCILMDCNMPIMDGWEATQEIQKVLYHKVPIVAVTANALKGDREKCLEAGMDDYITKPVKRSLLLDIALQWINLSRTKQDAEEGHVRAIAEDDGSSDGTQSDASHLLRLWSPFYTSWKRPNPGYPVQHDMPMMTVFSQLALDHAIA